MSREDQSGKFKEIAPGVYQIHPGKKAELKKPVAPKPSHSKSAVLKAEDLNGIALSQGVKVSGYSPVKMTAEKPIRPNEAVEGLKQNLKNLNDLHNRLKFMLKELEELVLE